MSLSKIIFRVIFSLFVVMMAIVPSQAQNALNDEKMDKCIETLGISLLFVLAGEGNPANNVAKVRQIMETRSAAIEQAISNIEGDFALASDLGDLGEYETSYLILAGEKHHELQDEFELLKRVIPCWQHLEQVLKLAALRRPKLPNILLDPDKPSSTPSPTQGDPDPYGIKYLFRLAKTKFDEHADEVAKLERRLESNHQKINADLRTRQELALLKQVASERRLTPPDDQGSAAGVNTTNMMPYSNFISFGVGSTFPSDTALSPFNQYVPGERGYVGSVEGGIRFYDVFGSTDVSISLLTEFGSNPLNRIVNFGGDSGIISGTMDQFGIQPTLRLTAPLTDKWEVSGEVGAGVRYQRFRIDGALDATGWPFTWHVGGNLMRTLPTLPGVSIGPWIKYTQTGPLSGVPISGGFFKTDGRTETSAGILITIKPVLQNNN